MIKYLLYAITFFVCINSLKAQLYSPTTRISVSSETGPGILGLHAVSVSNNAGAYDGNPQTYSTLVSAVSVLGIGSPFQELAFTNKVPAGTTIHIKVGTAGGLLGVGSGINIDTYNGTGLFNSGVVDSKVVGGSGTLINLLSGGNIVDYTFKTTGECQYIRVSFPSILGVANGFVRLYDVYYEQPLTSGQIACNNISDYLYGVDANAVLDAASLTNGVVNPGNAFDGDANTSASLVAVAAVLNYSQLTAIWPGLSRDGDSVHIIFDQGGTALQLNLLTNLSIYTFSNDTLIDNLTSSSNLLNLRLISGSNNKYMLSFAPTKPFNRISFRNGAILAVNLGVTYNVYEITRVAKTPTLQTLDPNYTNLYSGNTITLPNLTANQTFDISSWYSADSIVLGSNTISNLNTTTKYYGVTFRKGCGDIYANNLEYVAHVVTARPVDSIVTVLPRQGTNRTKLSVKLGGDFSRLSNTNPTYKFSNITGIQDSTISGLKITENGDITGEPLLSGTFPVTTDVFDSSNNISVGKSLFSIVIPYSLPVKYAKTLSVTNDINVNNLSWTTSQEINNKGFYVQKSYDGSNWEDLTFISSKDQNGTGLGQQYNYTDTKILSGVNYYRLKQSDLDGTLSYSSIVFININSINKEDISIYPNPAINLITLNNVEANQQFQIVDMSGKILLNGIINNNTQQIDISKLHSGMFIIKINNMNAKTIKVIKLIKK